MKKYVALLLVSSLHLVAMDSDDETTAIDDEKVIVDNEVTSAPAVYIDSEGYQYGLTGDSDELVKKIEMYEKLEAILQEHTFNVSFNTFATSTPSKQLTYMSEAISTIIGRFDTFPNSDSVPKNADRLTNQLTFLLNSTNVSLLQDYTISKGEAIMESEDLIVERQYVKTSQNPMQALLRIDSLMAFNIIKALRPRTFLRKSFIETLLSYYTRKEPSKIKAELAELLQKASL